MNILIYTDEYYPQCKPCAFRMQSFAETLTGRGHHVTVLTAGAAGTDCPTRRERILFVPAVSMRKKSTLRRLLHHMSFGVMSLLYVAGLGPVDLVISTGPPPVTGLLGWMIGRCKGAELVYDVRDLWPEVALEMGVFPPDGLYDRFFRAVSGFLYRRAALITTVSPGKCAKLLARPCCRDKVLLIENGFLEEPYDGDRELAARFGLDRTFTCVYTGNIGLAQGLERLLELARHTRRRDVQFLIFGDGVERSRLERQARQEGLAQVKFCGSLSHRQICTVLRWANISFIPLKSADMRDSIPTKLYEALGLGCPVLLMAEGDACKLVEETGLGCCVSPGAAEQLPAVFDRMVEEYPRFAQRREAAMALIRQRYSRSLLATRLAEELERRFG